MSNLAARVRQLHDTGHRRDVGPLRDDHQFADGAPRDAAVLIAITESDRPGFLMIHRPSNMRAHPGQVAFPGGKLDPGEPAVEAALREAWEELGIHGRDVEVIGTSDVYRTGTGYSVTPVIAIVPANLPLVPNPTEVAAWFEAPVDFVFDPANHQHHSTFWKGAERRYIEIIWDEHRIWGVTAAIIANLSRRLDWQALGT